MILESKALQEIPDPPDTCGSEIDLLNGASEGLLILPAGEQRSSSRSASSGALEEIQCDTPPAPEAMSIKRFQQPSLEGSSRVLYESGEVVEDPLRKKFLRETLARCLKGCWRVLRGSHTNTARSEADDDLTLEETLSLKSKASVASGITLSSGSTQSKKARCFLPETLFKTLSGEFIPVHQLQEKSCVCGVAEEPLRICSITKHSQQERTVVELRTVDAHHVVTADHSVVIGKGETAQASELQVGDLVSCSTGPQQLVHIENFIRSVEVFEIVFHPNDPVNSFILPPTPILTMGSMSRTSWAKTRRGGMARRRRSLATQHDHASVPDTADSWW